MQPSIRSAIVRRAEVTKTVLCEERHDFMRAMEPATRALLMLVPLAIAYPSAPNVLP